MLDCLVVIGKGGILTWELSVENHSPEIRKDLFTAIREMIILDYPSKRHSTSQSIHSFNESSGLFQVDWMMDNEFFYIAIHPKMLILPYIHEFLPKFKQLFREESDESCNGKLVIRNDFQLKVVELIKGSEERPEVLERKVQLTNKPIGKQRNWDLNNKKLNSSQLKELDYSSGKSATTTANDDDEEEENIEVLRSRLVGLAKEPAESKLKQPSRLFSLFSSFTGERVMGEEERVSMEKKFIAQLVERNVAREVAAKIAQSTLADKKKITNKTKMIQQARQSIQDILTPPNHLEFEQEIKAWRNTNPSIPYSLVFVGVNGVGKSTNLSKLCYRLMQQKYKILIAACDTFRSGAVEQLKVHVRNLSLLSPSDQPSTASVELFQRGYGKDAAAIAKEAFKYACQNQFDILLVDTAGRMQDNEPLMRSLGSLVKELVPNKVLFVGEALVGSEATDQLANFNKALRVWGHGRNVDGILLTKFDTVDERVGAALSMAWESGAPVVFVGTGQTYTDLKRPNIDQICDYLLG